MASLAEELSKLANPIPKFRDPEDELDEGLSNQISSQYINTTELQSEDVDPSRLRRQAVHLLSDSDVKYQGRKASRKSLAEENGDLSSASVDFDLRRRSSFHEDHTDEEDKSEESSSEQGNSSQEDDDVDISTFKKQLELKTALGKEGKEFQYDDNGDFGQYGDMSDDMDESDGGDDTEDDDSLDDGSEGDSGVENDDKEEGKEDISSFLKSDISEEIEKGKAVKHQISLWDSLLEGRIKLQKAVTLVNQLPQPDTWQMFEQEGGDNFTEASRQSRLAVKTLLDNLIELQTLLLVQNPETKFIVTGQKDIRSSAPPKIDSDDEEITSESETEEKCTSTLKSESVIPKYLKRKLTMEDYPEFLAKRHADFQAFRNTTIQKWSDKTRLATGKLKSKSFGAFELSALKQIEQIMADKDRLIKRTQLKRSVYKILGKEEKVENDSVMETSTEADIPNQVSKENPTKTHDEEIFDDDDFYHQLLRELIERKTSDVSDPVTLSRQWLEIQRLRTKVKKKVDTKASKGRKLRYDVHKKLVNFMAPVDHSTWLEESKDDLYRSLFGKRFESVNKTVSNG
ncbi:protein AATF-like [Liolophura sinensis]|uniref:protein AATF-like n=1 Tax=Liolophura sinensis TaxID=3198878 RepID=UPI003158FD4F